MKESRNIGRDKINYANNCLALPEIKHYINEVHKLEVNWKVVREDGGLWTEVVGEKLDANDILRIRDTIFLPHSEDADVEAYQTTWLDYVKDSTSERKLSDAETFSRFERLESIIEHVISKLVEVDLRDL